VSISTAPEAKRAKCNRHSLTRADFWRDKVQRHAGKEKLFEAGTTNSATEARHHCRGGGRQKSELHHQSRPQRQDDDRRLFVICSGNVEYTHSRHRGGHHGGDGKAWPPRELIEGWSEASWVLLSYGDVIAHIMAESQRDFYKLEKLWTAAPTGATVDEVSNEVHVDKFEEDDEDELDEDFEHEPDEFEESEIVADEAPGGAPNNQHHTDRE